MLFWGAEQVRAIAYLFGGCCAEEHDVKEKRQALGLLTQNSRSSVEPLECLSVSKW